MPDPIELPDGRRIDIRHVDEPDTKSRLFLIDLDETETELFSVLIEQSGMSLKLLADGHEA